MLAVGYRRVLLSVFTQLLFTHSLLSLCLSPSLSPQTFLTFHQTADMKVRVMSVCMFKVMQGLFLKYPQQMLTSALLMCVRNQMQTVFRSNNL